MLTTFLETLLECLPVARVFFLSLKDYTFFSSSMILVFFLAFSPHLDKTFSLRFYASSILNYIEALLLNFTGESILTSFFVGIPYWLSCWATILHFFLKAPRPRPSILLSPIKILLILWDILASEHFLRSTWRSCSLMFSKIFLLICELCKALWTLESSCYSF